MKKTDSGVKRQNYDGVGGDGAGVGAPMSRYSQETATGGSPAP